MYRENERWEVTNNEHYAFGIELVSEGKTRLKTVEQGSSKDRGNQRAEQMLEKKKEL